jgi:hypothetical protein
MKSLLLFGLMLSGGLSGYAQDGFVAQSGAPLAYNVFDRNGRTFVNPSPDVGGSPFFADDWRLGTVILVDNRRYDSVKLRLNLYSGEVHVMDSVRKEMALEKGYVKEILLPGKLGGMIGAARFQCGFPSVDALDGTFLYEVISEGRCWLLHSVRKVISQRKDDLSGEITKEYRIYEDYYVYNGATMQRIKKDKDFLLTVLADKRDKVESFINDNHLRFKSTDDFRRAIDYYNTLQ